MTAAKLRLSNLRELLESMISNWKLTMVVSSREHLLLYTEHKPKRLDKTQ